MLLTTLIVAVPNGTVNDRGRSTFVFAICIFAFIRFVENVWKGGFKLADPLLLTPAIGVVILAVLQLFPEYSFHESTYFLNLFYSVNKFKLNPISMDLSRLGIVIN